MKLIIAAAMGVMLSTGAAAQSVLTQNVLFGPSTTDLTNASGLTTNGVIAPFFFFDSRVGTLNSITFASSYSFSSVLSVNNTSSTTATGILGTRSEARFSSDDDGITAALNRAVNTATPVSSAFSPVAYNIIGNGSSYQLAPGASSTPFTSMGSGTRTLTDTNALNLAAFTRFGTFSYNPLLSTLTDIVQSNAGGNVTDTSLNTLQGNLTISYNFSPFVTGAVPEPASWAMMILGLGLIGGALRRGRRAAAPILITA